LIASPNESRIWTVVLTMVSGVLIALLSEALGKGMRLP